MKVLLALILTGQFMAVLDASIVNVAIPTIRLDLGASGSDLQLIVAGYVIAYAVLLITGARLGMRFGYRTAFVSGLALFTAASFACGIAPTSQSLIILRAIQGAGAALMVPQVFSLIHRNFTGPARAQALSLWAASLALGGLVGQVLGGVLVSADLLGTGWRPVFLVNVPIGLVLPCHISRSVLADKLRKLLPVERNEDARSHLSLREPERVIEAAG
jgi:MFS family permease